MDLVQRLDEIVRAADGASMLEACPPALKREVDIWSAVGGELALMRRLKQELDPKGILNPGRFVGRI